MKTRVLIVDDSKIFRGGLRAELESQSDREVCGEAADGIEGIDQTRRLTPDLVIIDLAMPRLGGIEAASQILKEFPCISILLLTLYVSDEIIERARSVGIRAVISKIAMHHLEAAIDALLRGEHFVIPLVDRQTF